MGADDADGDAPASQHHAPYLFAPPGRCPGSLLRALHDATRNSALAGSFPVVCHHDCGPNDVVFRDGLPYAFGTAARGLPLEDVGYMA
ncbi:hypothetical protein [Streptomyces mirabilis]|uniref:hypothetical protein n=1 Tax=Streptomyces mirabilis TaxID=68239 RepID=UPI003318D53D